MDTHTQNVHNAIRTLYNENPALGSYMNRMGDRLGVGADEQAKAAEAGASTNLTTLRQNALAQAAGYDPGNADETRDFILTVLDDLRFKAYAVAYAEHGKNSQGGEYRYSVEQSVAMERVFNNYFPEQDNTEPDVIEPEPTPKVEPPKVESPKVESPKVESPKAAQTEVLQPAAPVTVAPKVKVSKPKTHTYKATIPKRSIPKPHEPETQHPDFAVLTKRNIPDTHMKNPQQKIKHRGLGERIITAAKNVYRNLKHFFERISRNG